MYATFVSSEQLADCIKTYWFKPERVVDYIPGQFLELMLVHPQSDHLGERRWFTISSSPTEPRIAITMRYSKTNRHRHSTFKQALDRMQPGETLQLSDPMGDFVLPLDTSIPLVWIAGGIGITPFRSMAKWLQDTTEHREITLFHNVRNTNDALFKDLFEVASINRLVSVTNALQDCSQVRETLTATKPQEDSLFYISGPETMTASVQSMLHSLNISNQQIIVDTFLGY